MVRFPEAWFPGKFDYIVRFYPSVRPRPLVPSLRRSANGMSLKRSGSQGASHQLWHLLIVAAGLWHYHSLIEVYQERLDVPCIVA